MQQSADHGLCRVGLPEKHWENLAALPGSALVRKQDSWDIIGTL